MAVSNNAGSKTAKIVVLSRRCQSRLDWFHICDTGETTQIQLVNRAKIEATMIIEITCNDDGDETDSGLNALERSYWPLFWLLFWFLFPF